MASPTSFKLACALLLCMVVAAPHAEAAITCSIVASKMGQCVPYLKGGSGPSGPCCEGVKALEAMAATPADRQTACGCLKTAAASIKGLQLQAAAALPGKCGASIPYVISPSIDCSKVH